jgi:hypothetical protein
MDARITNCFRILILLLLAVVEADPQNPVSKGTTGRLFAYAALGECTETQVNIELTGVAPLPDRILLQIHREEGSPDAIVSEEVQLKEGKGKWVGRLLPLGKFHATARDVSSKQILGEYVFPNRSIVRSLLSGERSELVKIRGGKQDATDNAQSDAERSSYRITGLPKPNGRRKLHIIMIYPDGAIADEFFGVPSEDQQWNSRGLPHGDYRLMVVDYDGDNPCQVFRAGNR